MKPAILILSDSDVGAEPRVAMEIEALSNHYELTVAATGFTGLAGIHAVRFIPLPPVPKASGRLLPRIHRKARGLWRRERDRLQRVLAPDAYMLRKSFRLEAPAWLRALDGLRPELILVHHAINIPIALRLAHHAGSSVIFNAHEYYPRQFEGNEWWDANVKPVTEFICQRMLPRVDRVITVSQGIADEYRLRYGVDARVVMSTKKFHQLRPTHVDGSRIRIIHHGIANPNRQLEQMIDLVDLLDERFEIHFMLVPSPHHKDYFEFLARRINDHPRLTLVDPVPSADIVLMINQYDIGLFLVVPSTFNLLHCLPNKFFEFVQARLGLAFTPVPEVARIIRQFGLGVLSDGYAPASMAEVLNSLSADDVAAYKLASNEAARPLSSDGSYVALRKEVSEVLASRPTPAVLRVAREMELN